MATFEEEVANRGLGYRPPRSVMKGGLARAAAAGERATNAGLFGGASRTQMTAAMSPELESFTAQLRTAQLRQNFGEALTQLRTANYVDQAVDSRAREDAFYNERNRTSWDEAIVKGAAVAQVLSGVAGIISDKGTKTVDTDAYVDKEGNPLTEADIRQKADYTPTSVASSRGATGDQGVSNYLQSNAARGPDGKPLKIKQRELQKSAAAETAEKVQDALGKVFPNIRRYNDSKRKEIADSVDIFNMQRKEAMLKEMSRYDEMDGLRQQLKATKELHDALLSSERDNLDAVGGLAEMVARQGEEIDRLTEQLGSADKAKIDLPSVGALDPLISVIIGNESGPWGHNAYNNLILNERGELVVKASGDVRNAPWNTSRKPADEFTLGEVKELQKGGPTEEREVFAWGLGQFIPATLDTVTAKAGIPDDTKMTLENQTKIIAAFMYQTPEIREYMESDNPTEDMLIAAADRLTGLYPSIVGRSGKGSRDGDGLNKGRTKYSDVLNGLRLSWQRHRELLLAEAGGLE